MKTLVVYCGDTFEKFEELQKKYLYNVSPEGYLNIYKRNHTTGEEKTHAVFKSWAYFLIEES